MKNRVTTPPAAQRVAAFMARGRTGTIRLEAAGTEASLYIYDFVGQDFWGEGVSARSVQKDLEALKDIEVLHVYINSPGGDVFDGVTIFNLISRVRARKVVHIDGLAASIASVIAMAGDEIEIASNGMMMIHDPWAFAMGSADELRKTADVLDTIRDTIAGTYVARTGGARDEIVALMADETWMDADEAVERGFADRKVEATRAEDLTRFDLQAMGFRHPPQAVAETPDMPATETPDMPEAETAPDEAGTAPQASGATQLSEHSTGRRRHPAIARAAVAVAALRRT